MTSGSLDDQIGAAAGLISLLLVFVFAYFSAVLPLFEEVRHRATPVAQDDKEALVRRLSSYRLLGCGLLGVVVVVVALLAPLSLKTLRSQLWHPFQTLRVGLLVLDVLLLATGAGVVAEVILLTHRARQLR